MRIRIAIKKGEMRSAFSCMMSSNQGAKPGGIAMLAVNDIAKEFKLNSGQVIQAVTNTTFQVSENEFCILLGPSGCGKSTVCD